MIVTDRAAQRLKDVFVQQCLAVGVGLRLILVVGDSDRSTFGIKLDIQCPGDEVTEFCGVRVLLDPGIARIVKQHELDYLSGPVAGFALNATGGTRGGLSPRSEVLQSLGMSAERSKM